MKTIEDIEINKELKEIENDKRKFERELNFQRDMYANMLLNGMGDDINDVLSGKVKVKLTWKEKMKYTFRYVKDKILNMF